MAEKDTEQSQILQIYAAFVAALILSLLPYLSAAFMSLFLGLLVLVMAYMKRSKAEEKSLIENHMTFIIRTIWIGSFIGLLFTVIAALYLFFSLDQAPLNDCAEGMLAMGSDLLHPEIFKTVFAPCQDGYLRTNMVVLLTGFMIAAFPTLFYFGLRLIRGLSRAAKGYRLADPKIWF